MDDKKETKATDHKTKAEVVGNLEDVAQNGDCKDGRYLYSASLGVAFDDGDLHPGIYEAPGVPGNTPAFRCPS